MPSTRSLIEIFLAERALKVSANTVLGDEFYLKRFFKFAEGLGVDEVQLIPTSDDLAQLERVAQRIG